MANRKPAKKAAKKAPAKKKRAAPKKKREPKPTIYDVADPAPYLVAQERTLPEPSEKVTIAVSSLTKRGVPAQIACRIYGVSYSLYIRWRERGIENLKLQAGKGKGQKLNAFGLFVRSLDIAEAEAEAKLVLDAVDGLRNMSGQLEMLARRFSSRWNPKVATSDTASIPSFEDAQAGVTHDALAKAAGAMAVLEALQRAQHPSPTATAPENAEAAIPADVVIDTIAKAIH